MSQELAIRREERVRTLITETEIMRNNINSMSVAVDYRWLEGYRAALTHLESALRYAQQCCNEAMEGGTND